MLWRRRESSRDTLTPRQRYFILHLLYSIRWLLEQVIELLESL